MGIEWLAEPLRDAKEVHVTESGRRVGRQTEGNSSILIGDDRCNGFSDRWVGVLWARFPFLVGGAKLVGRWSVA